MKHNVPLKLGYQTIRVDELTKSYEENIYNEVSVIKTKELTKEFHINTLTSVFSIHQKNPLIRNP